MPAEHETMTAERFVVELRHLARGCNDEPHSHRYTAADMIEAQSATIASLREAAKGATVIVNQAGAAIREKDATIAGLRDVLAVAREKLLRFDQALTYPVATEINPRGWAWRHVHRPDILECLEFIKEENDTALPAIDALKSAHPAQEGE